MGGERSRNFRWLRTRAPPPLPKLGGGDGIPTSLHPPRMTRSATTSCGASIACSKSAAVAHQYSGFWSGTGDPRRIYLQLMQHARTRKRRDRPICGKCACPLNHRVALGQTFGRRARKTSATRLAIISCTEETPAPPSHSLIRLWDGNENSYWDSGLCRGLVAQTNTYSVNVRTDRWLRNLGRHTVEHMGHLANCRLPGVAGLPPDHQSVYKSRFRIKTADSTNAI